MIRAQIEGDQEELLPANRPRQATKAIAMDATMCGQMQRTPETADGYATDVAVS